MEYVLGAGLSWTLLGVLAAVSLFWYFESTRKASPGNRIPPCPVKPWPIVGHFLMLKGDLRKKLKNWQERTGGVYSLYFGNQLNIVVNNLDVIKEIMNKHSESVVNTPPSFVSELIGGVNTGIITARDDNWKEQRSTSLAILRSFGMGKDLMANKIQEESTILFQKISSLEGQPLNPKALLQTCVSNVICFICFGERFEHDDPLFVKVIDNVTMVHKYTFLSMILTPLKVLYYLPWDIVHAKKWINAMQVIAEFVNSYIQKFKAQVNTENEADNFIKAYLDEMKKNNEKNTQSYLSEANLASIVRTLFLAGTESVAVTIVWSLLYLIHNPGVQEKVYKEIVENIGTDRFPCIGDKQKLPFLNAVVLETQRLASVVPVGLRREVKTAFNVGEFTFPEGSIVWPILDSVHRDKNIWDDPDTFQPERFIDNNGLLVNREELIPFGLGKRICLGEGLARMQLFLFLSVLLQRFKIVAVEGELYSVSAPFGAVCAPAPFQVKCLLR